MAEESETKHPSERKVLARSLERNGQRGPFLVVGLGNPGLEYLWTPHNAGFMAVDRLAEQEGVVVSNRRCRAITATCRIAGREVVLAKPETFMNLSGAAVAALIHEFDADPAQDLLVIYDELDLVLGTFKIRERGSPAGHNGARSVTSALGSQEWLRLRVGVGLDLAPHGRGSVHGDPAINLSPGAKEAGGRRPGKDYLLSQLRKADLTVLDDVLDRVAAATRRIIQDGPGPAMNEFNRKDTGQ